MLMTQEFRSDRPSSDQRADDRLADRLDAAAVESVIRRAIELEQEDPSPTRGTTFTPAQVERIAGELGINSEFIRRAITEVKSAPPKDQRKRLDRYFLPERLVESSVVEGMNLGEVEALLADWMMNREGMRLVDRTESGGEWEVDPHWLTKLRTALNSGSGRLRAPPGPVRHRIEQIGPDQHVIALEASETVPQILGRVGIGLSALLTVSVWLGAFFGALGGLGIVGTGLILLSGGLLGAGVLAGVGAAVRSWGRRMKRRLRTALFRMSNKDQEPPASRLGDIVASFFGSTPRRR